MKKKKKENLQDIGENAHGPHVRVESNRFSFNYFWSGEFGGSRGYFDNLVGIQFSRQTEIDEFHIGTFLRLAHYVFRFYVQMDDISFVHVFDGFAYLSHIIDYLCFGHRVPFRCDPLEQLSTGQTIITFWRYYQYLITLMTYNIFYVQFKY